MNKLTKLIASGAIGAFALTGCGASGGANAPAPNTQTTVTNNVLQFAVGAVNLFGAANGGLNVVVTYRQPAGGFAPGDSGTLVNSPTITLPAASAAGTSSAGATMGFDPSSSAAFGSAASETSTTTIGSTSQVGIGNCGITTFGQSGGAFGTGIEPYNAVGQGDCAATLGLVGANASGTPFQVAPYAVPLWDTTAGDVNKMDAAWGGPPALVLSGSGGSSVVGNGNYPGGTKGIALGIDVFQGLPAAVGSYKLNVNVPANTGTVNTSSTFALAAVNDLGTAGAAPAFVATGGGGTVTLGAGPAGAWTEVIVQITDYGAVGAAPAPASVWYTLEATKAGGGVGCTAGVCTLPAAIGPGGAASTAAGDQIVTQVVYVDYPLYEMQYGTQAASSGGKPAPAILGVAGSADMSISTRTCTIQGGANCNANLPLLHEVTRQGMSVIRKH